jgi:hypothetical protein
MEQLFERLMGLRPSVQEQVNHTAHTQIEIPWRQARLAAWVRFMSYAGIGLVVAIAAGAGWILDIGRPGLAAGLLVFDFLLILFGLAAVIPRRLLLERLEREIRDPYRDDVLRGIAEMYLERMEQPEPEVVIQREPVPWRVNGEGRSREYGVGSMEQEMEEPPTVSQEFLDLIEFAEIAVERGLARSAWLPENGPRVGLSSGTVVTRGVWRDFCETLMEWDVVGRDNSNAFVWTVEEPIEAVAMLRRAAEETMNSDRLWEPDEPVP